MRLGHRIRGALDALFQHGDLLAQGEALLRDQESPENDEDLHAPGHRQGRSARLSAAPEPALTGRYGALRGFRDPQVEGDPLDFEGACIHS